MNISLGPSDEYLQKKMREAFSSMGDAMKRFNDAWNAIQIGYSNPIFSDEYAQRIREACEEIERQWNQFIEQITQAGGNWDKMQELAIYSPHSNPPNLYARETAKRRKCNPQKLRKTDLYFRSKPPIIRRS